MLPAAVGIIVALVGIVFFVVSQQPERTTLYASLPEAEKSRVIDALKNAGVDVALDPTTGCRVQRHINTRIFQGVDHA